MPSSTELPYKVFVKELQQEFPALQLKRPLIRKIWELCLLRFMRDQNREAEYAKEKDTKVIVKKVNHAIKHVVAAQHSINQASEAWSEKNFEADFRAYKKARA